MTLAIMGYASVFSLPDAAGDMVAPGAFRRSLTRRNGGAIRMLFQHDPAQPVGVWDVCQETGKGLYAAGRILSGVQRGADLIELIRSGAIDGLSIGFRVVKAIRDRATGRRLITEIDLWEISIVTFPMLAQARIERISSLSA